MFPAYLLLISFHSPHPGHGESEIEAWTWEHLLGNCKMEETFISMAEKIHVLQPYGSDFLSTSRRRGVTNRHSVASRVRVGTIIETTKSFENLKFFDISPPATGRFGTCSFSMLGGTPSSMQGKARRLT